MENTLKMKNKDLITALVFAAIGLAAGYFTGLYQVSIASEELKQQIISQAGSMNTLMLAASAQGALYSFLSAFIGLKLARKVNLKLNFGFDKSSFIIAVLIGAAVAFIISGYDRFVFSGYLPEQTTNYAFSPEYFMVGILYGGVVEELLLRLLVMSLLVFILWKLSGSRGNTVISDRIYITAIVLAALLFAAGHLPITAQTLGLSAGTIVRCFVLNGFGGIGFGYLYWKRGLAYSMYAHAATHVFMQAVFMPLFAQI
jgi:hypothetical protein